MRPFPTALLILLALGLGACATHKPPHCSGTLEPINTPAPDPSKEHGDHGQ